MPRHTLMAIALCILGNLAPAQQPVSLGGITIPADSPLARGEYPRLMITRADLPAIRKRVADPEMQTYVKQAEDIVAMDRATPLLLGTLYQVTGERQYAEMALSKLKEPSWFPDWIMAYDMTAETLTAAERKAMAAKFLAAIESKEYRWRPRLLLCLAAWGNGLDDKLLPYLEETYQSEVVKDLAHHAMWSRGRGGSSMGHGYNAEHFVGPHFPAMMGWSHATGEDLSRRWDFADNTPAWYIYHYLPWERERAVINIGVTRDGWHQDTLYANKFQSNSFLMLPITETRNGLGQWWHRDFLGTVPQPGWDRGLEHREGLAGRLLWLDPQLPSVPPARFPETRIFPENGHVSMRSDWSADATVALFRCGRYGTIDGTDGRNNLDNLHFIIYRKGDYLAPDLGCVHRVNEKVWKMAENSNVHPFSKQTIAHNSITVGREPLELHGYNGKVVATVPRGGQAAVFMEDWARQWGIPPKPREEPFKQGSITAYSTSPYYDYACGDASHSYPPERVRKITRQFVYIKPDTFVIFDRVSRVDAALEVNWVLHSYKQPSWNGLTTADIHTHPERPGGHFSHTGGDSFSVEGEQSEMRMTTLLPEPEQRTVRTIGGRWHDFEINGVNYGPTEETYALLDDRKGDGGIEAIGGWRIEVSPTNRDEDVHFLHVLRTGDKDGVPPAEVSLLSGPDHAGASIVLGAETYVVTFRTQGVTAGHIRITGGQAPVNEDLVNRIEDSYDRWCGDPRYTDWMKNENMRTVIFPYGQGTEEAP